MEDSAQVGKWLRSFLYPKMGLAEQARLQRISNFTTALDALSWTELQQQQASSAWKQVRSDKLRAQAHRLRPFYPVGSCVLYRRHPASTIGVGIVRRNGTHVHVKVTPYDNDGSLDPNDYDARMVYVKWEMLIARASRSDISHRVELLQPYIGTVLHTRGEIAIKLTSATTMGIVVLAHDGYRSARYTRHHILQITKPMVPRILSWGDDWGMC